MRINARLDSARSQKLDFLKRVTHFGTSDVVKRAIDVYYDEMRKTRTPAGDVLAETGFIGSGQGGPKLSEVYKRELGSDLGTKHGDR